MLSAVKRLQGPSIKLLVIAAAFVLRWRLAHGELTLDEVWTLSLVRNVRHPSDIFLIREDNNHLLNSVFLYFIPQDAPFLFFRAASLASGLLTLLIVGFMLPRSGLPLLLLVAFHPLFVGADSSARGYALLIACSAASFRLALDFFKEPGVKQTLRLQAALCLGFLAHLSFASIYCGVFAWSLARLYSGRLSMQKWISLHALPAFTAGMLYLNLAGRMELRGGNPRSYQEVLSSVLTSLIGFSSPNGLLYPGKLLAWGISVLVLILLAVEICRQSRNAGEAEKALFYTVSGLVFPLAILAVFEPAVISERYFISSLFILALVLNDAFKRFDPRLVGAFLCLFILGSAVPLSTALRFGNGNFRALASKLAAECPRSQVGGDHDFRIPLLVNFYLVRGGAAECRYAQRKMWASAPPKFLILHRPGRKHAPKSRFKLPRGPEYLLIESYESGDLAGFSSYLYRRSD